MKKVRQNLNIVSDDHGSFSQRTIMVYNLVLQFAKTNKSSETILYTNPNWNRAEHPHMFPLNCGKWQLFLHLSPASAARFNKYRHIHHCYCLVNVNKFNSFFHYRKIISHKVKQYENNAVKRHADPQWTYGYPWPWPRTYQQQQSQPSKAPGSKSSRE